MSINFLYSEKFFVILIAAVAILFNLLPYIRQYQFTPPDKTYVGSLPIFYDKPTYLSEMVQGQEGNWKIFNKYTTEPQKEAFVYPFYALMGHIAKMFNTSAEAIFLIGRFFFGLLLLFVVLYFIRYFINDEYQRRFAYFFCALFLRIRVAFSKS